MIQFIKAKIEDHQLLTDLCRRSKKFWGYSDELMRLWQEDLLITQVYIAQQQVYKILSENSLAGFLALEDHGAHFVIEHLWLEPAYIGNGLGEKAIAFIEQKIDSTKKDILLVADPNAQSFYEKHGFKKFDSIKSKVSGRVLPRMRKKRN